MSSVVDWSEMNPELIDQIMKRLDLIEFIRSGAVCKSWYSTMSTCSYITPPKRQTPWLILSSPHEPESRYVSSSADPKSLYKFNLPKMKDHCIIGSSHGFIISVDEIARIHATNPITGSHRLLPAITTLPHCEGAVRDPVTNQISSYPILNAGHTADDWDAHYVQKYFYKKVSFFPTSSAAGLISVLIHGCFEELALAGQSDESWTFIRSETVRNFEDVLFYKGLLYAVNRRGDLVAIDILNFSALSPTPVIYMSGFPEGFDYYPIKKYLVQSPSSSDLFLIVRITEELPSGSDLVQDDDDDTLPTYAYQTVGFKIFKLNQEDDGGRQWSEVSSFGTEDSVVVFLGFNPSVMLLAKDIPNFAVNKGDCIYFTEDDFFSKARHKKQQKIVDMGLFYTEGNKIFPIDDIQRFNHPPPFWFTPRVVRLTSGGWEC